MLNFNSAWSFLEIDNLNAQKNSKRIIALSELYLKLVTLALWKTKKSK